MPTKRGLVFWLIQILIWLNASFYLANVLSFVFQCNPVPKAWDASIKGSCINTNINLIVTGATNVLSDILILLLPLWTIWHLKLPFQKKLSVSAAFTAGILYTIPTITFYGKKLLTALSANFAGIMRLAFSVQIIHTSDLAFVRLQHGMWTYVPSCCTASIPLANASALPGSLRSRQPSSVPRYPSFRNSSICSIAIVPGSRPPPPGTRAAARRKAGYGRRGSRLSRSFGPTAPGALVLREAKSKWL